MFLLNVAQALDHYKIQYALVGGMAVALHGAVRGTVDVDIVLAINEENFCAFEKAMFSLNLKSRLPIGAQDIYRFRSEYIKKRNLIAWSFVNHSNPAQVVDVIITHDLKKMKAKKIKLSGKTISILTIQSLIAMKREANRPQDLEDIAALEALVEKD